ncbi:MAG TPA: inositol monophosphatase family protein [Fimbriimonas sp.]
MSPRLEFAIDAAYRAGRFTLGLFQTGASVDLKGDRTPVTEADRGAERIIRERIERHFPNERILGEEEGGEQEETDRWIVDPIDGTKSFVCGVPLYGTLVAYERQGRPVVGVCYFPALDEMLYAEAGSGAFFNGRPCRVSAKTAVEGSAVCSAGHNGMFRHGRSEGINQIAQKALATRTWCDAYGHALVATGRAEAMLDPVVKRWDVSSMILIVREAGGMCTDFQGGDPFLPVHPEGELELVSTNGALHKEILGHF